MDTKTPRYVTTRDVAQRYSISTRTVWRYVAAGILPKPVYLCGRQSGARWRLDELDRRDAEREQVAC